jgi:chemotaxis protein methyltransferase CheR
MSARSRLLAKDQTSVAFERLNSKQFDRFRDLIYENSGILVERNKVTLLSNRIRRRVNAGGFDDFDAYYRFLTSPDGVSEISGFLDAITTNETYFFRTPKQFDWFKSDWLNEQIAQHRSGNRTPELRVWSAGCADGAEPYSIAICLAENMYRLRDWSLQVIGTDISQEMLDSARAGIFKPRSVQAVTERQRRRYFQGQGETERWQIREPIKQLVEFKHHNLMEPLSGPKFDCIFIRNVLIYFDQQSKRIVIDNLLNALAVGGHLVVGPSEGVYDMLHGLKRVSPLIYQKVDPTLADIEPVHRGGQR